MPANRRGSRYILDSVAAEESETDQRELEEVRTQLPHYAVEWLEQRGAQRGLRRGTFIRVIVLEARSADLRRSDGG